MVRNEGWPACLPALWTVDDCVGCAPYGTGGSGLVFGVGMWAERGEYSR